MDKRPVPFKRSLFVCTHSRDAEGRVACADKGRAGFDILKAVKDAARAHGLQGVRIARSGCLDLCEKGPNAFLYPDGEWFCGLTPEDAPALVERLAKDL
ncbi:MAG: (2Fe-2S) ferredoxin domain-containing protein [Elusimicrobia bacterium]|nr:(2Fe-2S) ferredoxin domain-containing protein [Elusimicrobiota bacterium]